MWNSAGPHKIDVMYDGVPVSGSPFTVNARRGCDPSKVKAFGPGLERGVVNEPNIFTIETKGAGSGGLGLAIEGPSEAKMTCRDNRDGSCTVEYVPTEAGDYDISIKFADQFIPGSPFKVCLLINHRFLSFKSVYLRYIGSSKFRMFFNAPIIYPT